MFLKGFPQMLMEEMIGYIPFLLVFVKFEHLEFIIVGEHLFMITEMRMLVLGGMEHTLEQHSQWKAMFG